MHVKRFLHNLSLSTIHKKRLTTLSVLITALIDEKRLSLTRLGRAIKNKAKEKNNIKRCDRFLGNKKVHEARQAIYQQATLWCIGHQTRPLILVDWSHIPNTTHYLLRATLVAKGRGLSIYEQVFSKQFENSHQAHQEFLSHLKAILPDKCRPVLITDAGFYNAWFRLVLEQGWDYVGRIRGNVCYRLEGNEQWDYYSESINKATEQGQSLGCGIVSKTDPITTRLYLIKPAKKNRLRLNKYRLKGNSKKDKVYSQSAKDPWLLASSLDYQQTPSKIILMYAKRMQIEQNFRDLKSSHYGFSFEHAYSKSHERIHVLLMIAMLASLIAYLTGFMAESKQWHYPFQANTTKTRRVLSLFYLGCRLINKKVKRLINYQQAIALLRLEIPWAD